MGLILNRPTTVTIGQATEGDPTFAKWADEPLYLGGDVNDNMLTALHPHGDIPGSTRVFEGVFVGGDMAYATRLIEQGQAKPGDFRFFVRAAGWGPGQLSGELKRGVWWGAASSASLVLKHCIQ